MNFSIVLASRERVHLLDSLLNSIVSTTGDKSNCEVICVIDSDDRVTKRFVDRFTATCPFARFVIRERANNLNEDYLNWAWRNFATGDNILVVNDDVVFKTPNWDHLTMANLSRYLSDKPDGIAYGWIQEGLKNRAGNINYCCFPLITRKAAEAVGFVMPPDFPGWGADIGLYRIYSAIDRVCEIHGVNLDHISPHNGSREKDHINNSVERKSANTVHPIEQFDVGPHVEKLMRKITSAGSSVNNVVISGATILNATLTDVTIVGGKIVGGKLEQGVATGGNIEGGVLKSGTVNGVLQTGFVSGVGNVSFT